MTTRIPCRRCGRQLPPEQYPKSAYRGTGMALTICRRCAGQATHQPRRTLGHIAPLSLAEDEADALCRSEIRRRFAARRAGAEPRDGG